MRTTLFYGPWQCRQQFINNCQRQCAGEGYAFMGCMWLADIKLEWEGSLVVLPIPVKAGSRYGIYHCCCDYPRLTPAQKKPLRDAWDRARDSFRQDWSKTFGEWPSDDGSLWPCHHIRDLQHGGDPIDQNNLIPAQPGVHKIFNEQYPACYDGKEPWNTAGSDLPYTDD